MTLDSIQRADEIDVSVTEDAPLPDGWTQTHEEYKRPVDDNFGYYIKTFESEHFLISLDTDKRNGERIHHISLLRVKRDDNGNRTTAIGTGVAEAVSPAEDRPTYLEDSEANADANTAAEHAAFQLAYDLMQEVNAGLHDDKWFSDLSE